jgi:hypothetical protein
MAGTYRQPCESQVSHGSFVVVVCNTERIGAILSSLFFRWPKLRNVMEYYLNESDEKPVEDVDEEEVLEEDLEDNDKDEDDDEDDRSADDADDWEDDDDDASDDDDTELEDDDEETTE